MALTKITPDMTTFYQEVADAQEAADEALSLATAASVAILYTPLSAFGAVGDGVADDTSAILAALFSGRPLNWGSGTYRHTGINVVVPKINWWSNDAKVVYDGPYVRNSFKVDVASGENFVEGRITFDGSANCTTAFRMDSTSDPATPYQDQPVLVARGLSAINVLRKDLTELGGDGIYIVGGWQLVQLQNARARNLFMSVGAGVSGSQGIFGITVGNGPSGYAKRVDISSPHVENVWSLDPEYKADQDGIRVFQDPDDPMATCVINNYTCINVSGRALKYHSSTNGILNGLHRIMDSEVIPQQGLYNVPDVDSQQGTVTVSNVRFIYNGSWHSEVVRAHTDPGANRYPGAVVSNISGQVLNATGAGITVVGLNSSASGSTTYPDTIYRLALSNVEITGNVSRLVGATVRGSNRNVIQISNAAAEITEVGVLLAGSSTAEVDVQVVNAVNTGAAVPLMATTGTRRLQSTNVYGFTS